MEAAPGAPLVAPPLPGGLAPHVVEGTTDGGRITAAACANEKNRNRGATRPARPVPYVLNVSMAFSWVRHGGAAPGRGPNGRARAAMQERDLETCGSKAGAANRRRSTRPLGGLGAAQPHRSVRSSRQTNSRKSFGDYRDNRDRP